jgi:tRNA pseudouridine-54 N-methylase
MESWGPNPCIFGFNARHAVRGLFKKRKDLTMEIIIKGTPKEIAALVLEVQERRTCDTAELAPLLQNALAEEMKKRGLSVELRAD